MIWVILIGAFVLASALPPALWLLASRNTARQRLENTLAPKAHQRQQEPSQWLETLARAATPLAKISVPDEGWESSSLRRRFMQAGLRNPTTPVIFYAIKTLLAFGLPLLLWITLFIFTRGVPTQKFITLAGLICAAGFYLPNLVLNHLTRSRQREILEALPDALDLLTICVEAGLSLDAAVARVANEIELKSVTLAEELQLLTLELRGGYGRAAALRKLALRTGIADLDSLVAMLVQSEKFGTSIGESLRVHSGVMRAKRQSRAEERAGKVAVKLIFPLVLCIFPAILVVVAGPPVIRIVKVLPTLVGAGG